MAKFQYKAYTAQGAVAAGTIVADGIDAAIDALYVSGLTPFETIAANERDSGRTVHQPATVAGKTATASIWSREFTTSNRLSQKELTAFTAELATLVNSGLALDSAFRIIAGPGARPKTVRLANGLLKDVLGGMQLSEAMARRPEIFPSDYCAILAAGEAGGVTGQVLTQLAELLQRRLDIHGRVVTALVYPAVLMVMSVVSVGVIAFVLIPSISPIFTDAGLPLPGILGAFVDLQDSWLRVLVALGALVMISVLAWRRIRQNAHIMLGLDHAKCRVPIIGKLIEMREAGRFSRALGTLLGARVPLMAAMQTARALVTNSHLNILYGRAVNRVPEGMPLHRAFDDSRLLPPASLRMVAVGEESGRLGPMLLQIAGIIEADQQRNIERMVGLLTPLLTLAVGGCIGGLIMQVMSAVLSINEVAFQ